MILTNIKFVTQLECKVALQNQEVKNYLLLVLLRHLGHQQVIYKIQVFFVFFLFFIEEILRF